MHRMFVLALALVACGTPTDPTDDPTPTPTPTAGPETLDVTLSVDAVVDGAAAACGQDYTLGMDASSGQLADARLFVSAIEYRNADGEWVALTLEQDGVWQHENVVLLDFEDGTAGCADSGTPEMNTDIVGTLPDGTYDAVRFDVGVPFALNHNDSATAPAPLNAPGMFWTWQGGYKFVRVDFTMDGETPFRWNTHVGSTGCVSDAPVQAPVEECSRPNRASMVFESFSPTDSLTLDLAALVADTDVLTNTPDTPPGCMSNPAEPDDCGDTFAALGIDFATGACVDGCADQTVLAP